MSTAGGVHHRSSKLVYNCKNILTDNGLPQAWDDEALNNRELAVLKEKLYRNYMENCLKEINDSQKNPKLRTYKLFKTEFKLENYLMHTKNINHVLALAKFRISSHNLRIETGRYTKPAKTPINERICLFCSSQAIEDEIHFIISCTFYMLSPSIGL